MHVSDTIAIPIELVGAVLLLIVAVIAYMVARRRYIIRGHWGMILSIRSGDRWRAGMVRTAADHIEWFSLRGVRLRPTFSWSRNEFVLGTPVPVEEAILPLSDPVQLDCTFGGQPFVIAVSRYDYTALRSWSESSPPGPRSGVV